MTFFLLALSACQPAGNAEKLASGRVVSLGKEHLIVEDNNHVMFLNVDEQTKRSLNTLKRGDAISLLGRKEEVEVSPGKRRLYSEVYAIEKADGTRIALR